MPGYNHLGPEGNGPMTGRGRGTCAKSTNAFQGRGQRLHRNRDSYISLETEKSLLEKRLSEINQELKKD